MERRSFLVSAASALPLGALQDPRPVERKGRVRQSVCRWCYRTTDLETLAKESARLGLVGVDLIGPDEWPAVQKYGLIPTMAPGGGTIPDGLNRKENHARIEAQFRENIPRAAKNKVPNVITFSGNRRGMSDEEALDNCVLLLNKVKSIAEDHGVTIAMELLNSKVNHPDYQADRTWFGVEMCKRVNSPRVKLLYDIYHMQIMEGDVIRTIRGNHQWIAHYHTGGVPGRHEIDNGQELYYPAIAKAIVDTGFQGYFAHEFIPERTPLVSLGEAAAICDV
jgi:hydroxypyruvate isomerase